MSEKASILKEYAEFIYQRLNNSLEDLTEKEMKWKPTDESNNIAWILNHLSRITNISLPRIIKGDPDYIPEDWPEDYREKDYSYNKLLMDINEGKEKVVNGIGKLSTKQLEEDIPLWGDKRKRKIGLFAYLGEILHHRGQIAYIRGTIKRKREQNSSFLA